MNFCIQEQIAKHISGLSWVPPYAFFWGGGFSCVHFKIHPVSFPLFIQPALSTLVLYRYKKLSGDLRAAS